MGLGIQVDSGFQRVTYTVSLRDTAGLLGFELEQLGGLLTEHARLGHVVLEAHINLSLDAPALPALAVTVNGLLPEDNAWLAQRARRVGDTAVVPETAPKDPHTRMEDTLRAIHAIYRREYDPLDPEVSVTGWLAIGDALNHVEDLMEAPGPGILQRLRTAADAALMEALAHRDDIGGAVNWADLHCLEARVFTADDGETGYQVFIEEAAPDAHPLQKFVGEQLRQAGFPAVEVMTAW